MKTLRAVAALLALPLAVEARPSAPPNVLFVVVDDLRPELGCYGARDVISLVIVIGDHGYHLGEHGWWNKVTVYELGARSPMIAWVPGAIGMGKPTRAIVEFVDLYPTIIDYAGLPAPHKFAGNSLRPVFDNPAHPGKEAAYSQVNRGQRMSKPRARWFRMRGARSGAGARAGDPPKAPDGIPPGGRCLPDP